MRCLVFILGMRAGPRVLYLADAHIMESIISSLCKLERERFKAELWRRHRVMTAQRNTPLTHPRQVLCLSRFTVKLLQMLVFLWNIRCQRLYIATATWQ